MLGNSDISGVSPTITGAINVLNGNLDDFDFKTPSTAFEFEAYCITAASQGLLLLGVRRFDSSLTGRLVNRIQYFSPPTGLWADMTIINARLSIRNDSMALGRSTVVIPGTYWIEDGIADNFVLKIKVSVAAI